MPKGCPSMPPLHEEEEELGALRRGPLECPTDHIVLC